MAHGHKGIRNYSADEISNIAIGQSGFDVFTGTGEFEAGVDYTGSGGNDYSDVKYWVAMKAVNADAVVTARTKAGVGGHDFSKTGSYDTGQKLTIENGDIVYGVFDKIACTGSDYILAYRG